MREYRPGGCTPKIDLKMEWTGDEPAEPCTVNVQLKNVAEPDSFVLECYPEEESIGVYVSVLAGLCTCSKCIYSSVSNIFKGIDVHVFSDAM